MRSRRGWRGAVASTLVYRLLAAATCGHSFVRLLTGAAGATRYATSLVRSLAGVARLAASLIHRSFSGVPGTGRYARAFVGSPPGPARLPPKQPARAPT